VNVTTVTSETAFGCASSFVLYFTADRKIELCLCNVTELRHKYLNFFFYKNYAELCVIPTFVFLNQFLVLTILFNFRDWMKAAFFLSNIYKDTLASLCCVCQVKEIFRYPLWPYHVRSLVHLFQLTLTRGKQLLCITEKNCRDKWCN